MQIVLATWSLAGLGGSETYVVTVADHLQRLGHDVWLHAEEHGRSSDAAERLGLRVARSELELPEQPDVLIVQDGAVACELAARYPLTPQVFVAHSDIFDLQLPVQLPGLVAAVVVLYDRVERRIRALALPYEVVRLTQPVDVERFKPERPLPERPQVAITLGNYAHGERVAMLERACSRAGVELRHVGVHARGGAVPSERVLNEADIVFGKARVIYEAMACGRAAYVYDHNGGEGWVTADSYEALSADNFGGQARPAVIDEERLVGDLEAYRAEMGLMNRDLVVANHSATKHAAALVEVLERVAPRPRPAPVDAPLRELARLVRLHHRADAQAFALNAELQKLGLQAQRERAEASTRVQELESALERATGELAAARAELEAAHREVAAERESAGRARNALDELVATRRWRAVQAALAPADRLRARRRSARAQAPAPFVVGVPRSGTTLLRFQLDAHPGLAIPPETGFGLVAGELVASGPQELLAALTALETWPDLLLDRDSASQLLARVEPWSVGAGLRALYAALAAREGKARWGDKTPMHLRCMPALAELLPEAHFVHLIRDGRGVAGSVRTLPIAPGDGSIEAIADDWREQVVAGRRSGAALPHYREVRYERLVAEPEPVLRELCDFLELDFDPAMLQAHEQAGRRLAELPEVRRLGDGTVTRAERQMNQANVLRPPDPALAERWRETLTPDEIARFEDRAGDLLGELGYAPARGA